MNFNTEDEKTKNIVNVISLVIRYTVMYVLYRILETVCGNILYAGYLGTTNLMGGPVGESSYTVELVVLQTVFALIGAYSLFRTFSLHNTEARDKMILEHKNPNYFSILAYTAKSKDLLISLAVLVPFTLLFGANNVLDGILLKDSSTAIRLLADAAIMSLIMLFARTGANVYIFDSQTVSTTFEKIGKKGRLVKDVLIIFVTYLPGAVFCFLAFMMVLSIVKIVWKLPWLAVSIVTILFLLPLLIFVFRSVFTRKKFFKELRSVCHDNGFKLSEVKRPYASLFKFKSGVNFIIEVHGKKYSCGFISCIYRNSSVYFYGNGTYVQKYPVEIKKRFQLFDFQRIHKYGFDGEGIKVLIASPPPTEVYAVEFGNVGDIHSSDKLWDYKYFDEFEFVTFLSHNKI